MILNKLPKRGKDDWGSGAFRASRGTRGGVLKLHKGIDYACDHESLIHSPVCGVVTNAHGIAYNDDMSYTYIEIQDIAKARHRIFYIDSPVAIGQYIHYADVVGTAQDIAARYTTPKKVMKNHVHYEVLVDDKPVNPETYGT